MSVTSRPETLAAYTARVAQTR